MKYDLRRIMKRAWRIFRKAAQKAAIRFSEALHRAWLSAKAEPVNAGRIEAAKAAAGVTGQVETWSGWKTLGYEVLHGERALFGVELIWGSRGDGASYKARFFGEAQVRPIPAA